MSQEQIEGITSSRSLRLNTEPENCTEQTEEDVVKQGETEEERVELELTEGQIQKHDMSVGEGVENAKQQLEETDCRRDEDLLNEDNLEEDGAEKVEVEEEVQVIILPQSQERREEKVMKEDKGDDREKEAEKETTGGEMHVEEDTDSHLQNSYSKNTTLQTHSENFNSEKIVLETLSIGSYFEDNGQQPESGESNKSQTLSEDSYSGNSRLQKPSRDSYSENGTLQTHSVDSFFEKNTLNKHWDDFHSEKNALETPSNKPQMNSEDSYFGNGTLRTLSEDSYSENNTLNKHPEDSYSENETLQTHSHSFSKNDKLKPHSEDSEEFSTPSVSTPAMNPDSLWTEPDKSENGQNKQEEKKKDDDEEEEQECSCEEVGAGRSAERHTEGTETSFSSSVLLYPDFHPTNHPTLSLLMSHLLLPFLL